MLILQQAGQFNKLRWSYSIFPALSQTLIKLHKVPGHVTEVSLFVTKVPSFILRPASSPRFLGGGVCEERLRGGGEGGRDGGVQFKGVLLLASHKLFFPPIVVEVVEF